jgi:hypothetical protein
MQEQEDFGIIDNIINFKNNQKIFTTTFKTIGLLTKSNIIFEISDS